MHDLKGQLRKSIAHRSREIELIERLHEVAKEHDADVAAYMLRGRGVAGLRERRGILQSLKERERRADAGVAKAQ